jgi:NADH dehydrogenase
MSHQGGAHPHVVIVGAGFGGLAAAKELGEAGVRTTLVDRNNFHTFLPLLYQVSTAGLNPADVAYPVRGIFRRHPTVLFRQGTVTGVDWDAKAIQLEEEEAPDDTTLVPAVMPFDHLIVAAGSRAHFFGVEGAAEHSFPLYDLADAVHLRNHLLRRFEAADADPSLIDEGALTIVVVGGGPTGVEVAGATIELVDGALRRDYHDLEVDRTRVILVEAGDQLLAPFSKGSQRAALRTLRHRGVHVRLGTSVTDVEPGKVTLGDGTVLPAHTLVWAAGVQAESLAAVLGVEQNRGGRIVVQPDLQISGRPGSFAIGDVAHIVPDGAERALPQLAQVAIQGGHHAAKQVLRLERGEATEPFRYLDKGTMATIGRRAAVAELPFGIKVRGTLGWLSWLFLHLVMLVGFRNRISVFVNWAWGYLTWDRGARIILDEAPRAPMRPLPSAPAPDPGETTDA